MEKVFGDLYIICPSVGCVSEMGWPIRRKRQFTVLLLKEWIYGLLRDAGRPDLCQGHLVAEMVDLQGLDTVDPKARGRERVWKSVVSTP